MGFAFFAASTLADPDLGKKIVVIDDPMSSLDAPRRDHTIEVLDQISARAEQVIIMAHDAHFWGMQDKFAKRFTEAEIGKVHLKMVRKRYSDSLLDLDVLCQSQYLSDYQLVTDVVAGEISDPEGVARGAVALRPLLEGYLHRKYPKIIPTGVTLGVAIDAIEDKGGLDSPMRRDVRPCRGVAPHEQVRQQVSPQTHPDMATAQRESQSTIKKKTVRRFWTSYTLHSRPVRAFSSRLKRKSRKVARSTSPRLSPGRVFASNLAGECLAALRDVEVDRFDL